MRSMGKQARDPHSSFFDWSRCLMTNGCWHRPLNHTMGKSLQTVQICLIIFAMGYLTRLSLRVLFHIVFNVSRNQFPLISFLILSLGVNNLRPRRFWRDWLWSLSTNRSLTLICQLFLLLIYRLFRYSLTLEQMLTARLWILLINCNSPIAPPTTTYD